MRPEYDVSLFEHKSEMHIENARAVILSLQKTTTVVGSMVLRAKMC
jgi:hypothetical protein